jgi:acetyl coenzyme A synthetase (ADP forming)-like protein
LKDDDAPPAGARTAVAPAPPRGAAPRGSGLHGLDAILRPRSIAVIGASRERGTIGAELLHNLIARGFAGVVYPVNPRAAVVQSVRAYADLAQLPGPVDLALVAVPASQVLEAVRACGAHGVQGVVVISAGFKEVGGEGVARERELVEVVRAHGMRLVGPNCLGVVNTEPAVRLDATFAPVFPPPGKVAFSSQSGALGVAILETATQLNLGISHFVSVGNKADVSSNDLIEYWERDPGTAVILLYLESFGNPRRFTRIARRVARRKPIVIVKSGRTRAGMRAAMSHTGSLAGTDKAVDALCVQSGVIRTDTIEELFDVAMLVAHQPIPRGRRVAIVTNAGGPGIMASDACESHGLEVPELDPATLEGLRAFLPREAGIRNPVDMIASARPESFERAVQLVAGDPGIDAVLVIYVPPIVTGAEEVARAIVRGAGAAGREAAGRGLPPKPVLACFMGSHGVPDALRSLSESNVPSYTFPESAAIALARVADYGVWLAKPEGRIPELDGIDASSADGAIAATLRRAAPGAAVWLRPAEVRALLGAYGIATPEQAVAADADAAAAAARRIGFPVAVKLVSDAVTHKSDVGGVVLDLDDEASVRAAFADIAARMRAAGRARDLEGVMVQAMVRDGTEAIVGVTHDPSFGPMLMFGLGGTHVELLKDVVFRLPPITDVDAAEMVRAPRGFPLLQGYRGGPAADIAALETLLLRVSQLVGDHPEIVEMDLNPIKALAPGRGCRVVDARIAVRG